MLLLMLSACSDVSVIPHDEDDCEPTIWYADLDGDGFGSMEPFAACSPPDGYLASTGDCDDEDAGINPDADELCNGIDDDCDGELDEGTEGGGTWYVDADGDGYGAEPVEACEQPEGTVVNDADCDDDDPAVNPLATEICNDVDDDCDGDVDGDAVDASTWWYDGDGDGYGGDDSAVLCDPPTDYVDNDDDCDDGDSSLTLDCSDDPATISITCNGTEYRFGNQTGQPELIVLSVYEADGGHGGPAGNITVDIQRQTQMTLVLSSYENVDWTVTTAGGTTLDRVLANGYHSQGVSAPSGVPVEIRSYDQTGTNFGGSCGYSWPYNGGGCDTNVLINGVQNYTNLTVTEFAGCYHATAFTVK